MGLRLGVGLGASRSVAWSPAQLSGLNLWVRADVYSLASGKIDTWTDLSGKGNSPTQATAGNRATPVAAQVNWQPILRFSGSYYRVTFAGALSQPNTFFCVLKCSNMASVPSLWDGVAAGHRALVYGGGATTVNLTNGTVQIGSAAIDISTFTTLIVTHNGASSNIEANGTSKVTGDAGSNDITGITIGEDALVSTTPPNADVAEFGVINGAVSGAQLASLRGYLRARYATW